MIAWRTLLRTSDGGSTWHVMTTLKWAGSTFGLSTTNGHRQVISAVAGNGAIWVSQYQHVAAWLARIDPVAGTVTRTSSLPDQLAPAELEIGDDGTVWAAGPVGLSTGGERTPNGFVARIDLATGKVVAQAELPLRGQIDPGMEAVWVPSGSSLQRLDAGSLKVTETFPVAGDPATQCGLSATESGPTSTLRYLDPESGAIMATIDLGVDGHLLGNDPVEGTDNCWVLVGPPGGGDPGVTGSTLGELAPETTMAVAGQSPPFLGDVRFAAGTFWLIANRTMTPIDPQTLAPLGTSWLLPSDVSDPASWTLLGSGQTLWWVGPTEALRVGIPIPSKEAIGSIASQPWSGAFVPITAAFSDMDHGILVGATGNGAGAGVVATTSDGGRSWTKRLLASPPLFGVTMQGSLVLASASCRVDAPPDCLPALLRSTDGGLTWTVTREGGLDGVQLASGETAWATYNPTAYYAGVASSHDGGRTWRRSPSPCPPGFPVFEPTGISFPTATEGGWPAMGTAECARQPRRSSIRPTAGWTGRRSSSSHSVGSASLRARPTRRCSAAMSRGSTSWPMGPAGCGPGTGSSRPMMAGCPGSSSGSMMARAGSR